MNLDWEAAVRRMKEKTKKNKASAPTNPVADARDDPTDEFPVLDIESMAAEHEAPRKVVLTDAVDAEESADNPTVASLSRLEYDIYSLQDRWSAIESDLKQRDIEIEDLNSELAVRQSALKSMSNELDRAREEREQLLDQLERARQECESQVEKVRSACEELQARCAEGEEAMRVAEANLQGRQAEVDAAIAERDEALQEAALLGNRVDHERAMTAKAEEHVRTLEKVGQDSKVKIQDLEAYIDGRRADWQQMHDDVAAYRDTLLGMEKQIEEKDRLMDRHTQENVTLSETLLDLEQHCAELDGRRAEREAANNELQEKLVVASQDVERMHRELQRSADDHEAKLREIAARHEAEIEAQVKTALDRAEELEASLEEQQQTYVTQQTRIEEHEQQAIELWEELKRARDDLSAADAKLLERAAQIEKLETRTNEQADSLEAAARELEIRDEQVLELNAELRAQQKTTALLDRNVQRLAQIETYVKTLDAQLSRQGRQDGSPEQITSSRNGGTTPCIVAVKDGQSIAYPLDKKTMTIGRSESADIQLCRKYISRKHAKIVIGDSSATIEDLGSKNGIFVNDQPVTRRELHDGDRLEIGQLQFRFVESAPTH